ncbi:hypothetical protein CTEN210_04310 [Chaetoceros tenuissimus]|uniref:MYND-type domain-containing protein n=1 Tax=Chaetoceros tenuissimus TaxID=426638 RepID=A0AAD3CND3_9STRA|nr:hypothetical protein CTEN210_04310 [Chaetoceros tenuissimus]
MGKKSKRRSAGKRGSQKKSNDDAPCTEVETQTDNVFSIGDQSENSHTYYENELTKKVDDDSKLSLDDTSKEYSSIIDEYDDILKEFMLWSLSDEADLTPKKFAKMAPRMAKELIAGEATMNDILQKRDQTLFDIDSQINKIQYGKAIFFLMTGMKFDNREMANDFQYNLQESLYQNQVRFNQSPSHVIYFDSFQEVVSKWAKKSRVYLNDSIFFGKSKEEFDKQFQDMVQHEVLQLFHPVNEAIIRKYYMHPTARQVFDKEGVFYAQHLLVGILALFEEMHSCWKCKKLRLDCEENETKALICSGCKVAVYCSRECQLKDWKEGNHKNCCGNIGLVWSAFERRKKHVGRAIKKERILDTPITVNGIEKECFLRPCGPLDYFNCTNSSEGIENVNLTSMDVYYKNFATLACGGKHLLFGDETISSQLEEKIQKGYENVLSEFDPNSVTDDDVIALHVMAEMLQYSKESDLAHYNAVRQKCNLSVDRFITLYVCYEHFELGKKIFKLNKNKFIVERNLRIDLKADQALGVEK